jgi:lauroyl/myristoyl acyltransferase
MGLGLARHLPVSLIQTWPGAARRIYWRVAARRREVVMQNLLPVLNDDPAAAAVAARALFTEFALKIADLWRYEGGADLESWVMRWKGWEIYQAAAARGKGVLLVTPHLGNWEIGGAYLPSKGFKLFVLTQPEPDPVLTEMRRPRARAGEWKRSWWAKTRSPSLKSSNASRRARRWRC